jgi:protein-disulfide isomerase
MTLLGLMVVSGGLLATPYLLIEPYWHHPGWSDLPDLPTGKTDTGCHWIGAENPLVTVIEFSDYQCPHCRAAHKKMRFQAAKYPDEVRLIHNHLPLDNACNDNIKQQFHLRACEFSKAAECAGEQGLFWPMNDALFSIQDDMAAEEINLDRIAVQLGLDRSMFNDCMDADEIPECIQKDIMESRRRGVAGTPTFFIQSQAYEGGIPDQVIETEVEKARQKGP